MAWEYKEPARALAVVIAIVNIHCKQADLLPGMPANVPHFVCLWVCEINITNKNLHNGLTDRFKWRMLTF